MNLLANCVLGSSRDVSKIILCSLIRYTGTIYVTHCTIRSFEVYIYSLDLDDTIIDNLVLLGVCFTFTLLSL